MRYDIDLYVELYEVVELENKRRSLSVGREKLEHIKTG